MIKKISIIIAVIAALAAIIVFIYRYRIISYSVEKIIRAAMPEYVKMDGIRFDFKAEKAHIDGFSLEAPRGFSDRYIIDIAEVTCRYKLKGKTILDGLEIFDPVLKGMVLRIERLQDGRLNLAEMGGVLNSKDAAAQPSAESSRAQSKKEKSGTKTSDFIKLPQDFSIKQSKIVFIDRFFERGHHVITFENMESGLNLKMNDSYTQVLDVSSSGEGNVNGRPGQTVRWTISFDPNSPRLTMASRFEVSSVDLVTFEPYYDKFSPFEFARARVSGILIFNFDNGSIGSSNELHFNDLVFSVKPGYENKSMFETNVASLIKYFTTSTGEVIFDFKIKGDMSNPRFYLGPLSKQAVMSMVIDKVSDVIQQMSDKTQQAAGAAAGTGNTNVDKAVEAIKMFKGLLDKKSSG